ncbi:MAG TPA: response regulator [Nitrospirota bacterium]|nr:response regulator [Nitrospirota bacterium]
MKKFLIVDDEDLLRHSLASVFHDKDTEIISAATGEDALKAIKENQFNLCFLDMNLPDISGLEIMRLLRDVSPQTRIIMMTGSEITDTMLIAVRESAHCLLSKPFELEQVKSLVCRILSMVSHAGHDENLLAQGGMSSLQWISDDTRKHKRKPFTNCITCYAVAPHGDMAAKLISANIVDISESGMGILTDCQLQPGHLIRLSDAPIQGRGVVRWSVYVDAKAAYRAGIQFVSPEHVPY